MSQLPAVDGVSAPLRLKLMQPEEVAACIQRDPRLIVPVGTCEQHGRHMPLGADSIIVERLANDLSVESGVLVAPTVEYGVNVITEREYRRERVAPEKDASPRAQRPHRHVGIDRHS